MYSSEIGLKNDIHVIINLCMLLLANPIIQYRKIINKKNSENFIFDKIVDLPDRCSFSFERYPFNELIFFLIF